MTLGRMLVMLAAGTAALFRPSVAESRHEDIPPVTAPVRPRLVPLQPPRFFARTPVEGPITSRFGMRWHPLRGGIDLHKGVDLGGRRGTPVTVTGDGVVTFAGVMRGYGKVVFVDHGADIETRYAHLDATTVTVGEQVDAGDTIGLLGATGGVTGAHLHYEVRRAGEAVDPGLA